MTGMCPCGRKRIHTHQAGSPDGSGTSRATAKQPPANPPDVITNTSCNAQQPCVFACPHPATRHAQNRSFFFTGGWIRASFARWSPEPGPSRTRLWNFRRGAGRAYAQLLPSCLLLPSYFFSSSFLPHLSLRKVRETGGTFLRNLPPYFGGVLANSSTRPAICVAVSGKPASPTNNSVHAWECLQRSGCGRTILRRTPQLR